MRGVVSATIPFTALFRYWEQVARDRAPRDTEGRDAL